MTAHRVDIGSLRDPLVAGNPVRLDIAIVTNSGHPGSRSACNLSDVANVHYAVFRLEGDLPVGTPSLGIAYGTGVDVTSPTGGMISINLAGSLTGLWTGRDWHVARLTDISGKRFDIFDGYVVSTVGLSF